MNILVCGANGFIGRHLVDALRAAGHHVVCGVRQPIASSDIRIDYNRDISESDWIPRLCNIDAVINAVGILTEDREHLFATIHKDAPIALFQACEAVGIKRVIQISALGGSGDATMTPYMRTKREADAFLEQTATNWVILRPSLLIGENGESSRFFRALASLPVIGLPGKGEQKLQPVHIRDLCDLVVRLFEADAPSKEIIDTVGAQPMTYREMLLTCREAMGLASPVWLPIPIPIMQVFARVASLLPQKVFSPDTLRMLEDGNTADPLRTVQLAGRPLTGKEHWFGSRTPDSLRAEAIAGWMQPLFRLVLAAVWIVTGILSLGIYPVEDSMSMLAQVGLHGIFASVALYGAALLDIGLGMATLIKPSRFLWRLQFGLILGYTALITFFLPEHWMHPFGPVLKNLPILAILVVLDASEE